MQRLLNASVRVKSLQLVMKQLSGGGIGQRKSGSKSCCCSELGFGSVIGFTLERGDIKLLLAVVASQTWWVSTWGSWRFLLFHWSGSRRWSWIRRFLSMSGAVKRADPVGWLPCFLRLNWTDVRRLARLRNVKISWWRWLTLEILFHFFGMDVLV